MTHKKVCYICSSSKFVDNHHYDCCEGKVSPEIVPLCRRCHRTYHDWGIGAFSPDTTERALEVENKRREISRSLPPDHPSFLNLPPLKLEDVERSDYWYKKHGIPRPSHLGRKKPQGVWSRIPSNPLCGNEWLMFHFLDHSREEIEALTIEIACDNKWQPPVSVADKRGKVKAVVRRLRKEDAK